MPDSQKPVFTLRSPFVFARLKRPYNRNILQYIFPFKEKVFKKKVFLSYVIENQNDRTVNLAVLKKNTEKTKRKKRKSTSSILCAGEKRVLDYLKPTRKMYTKPRFSMYSKP